MPIPMPKQQPNPTIIDKNNITRRSSWLDFKRLQESQHTNNNNNNTPKLPPVPTPPTGPDASINKVMPTTGASFGALDVAWEPIEFRQNNALRKFEQCRQNHNHDNNDINNTCLMELQQELRMSLAVIYAVDQKSSSALPRRLARLPARNCSFPTQILTASSSLHLSFCKTLHSFLLQWVWSTRR